MNSERNWNVFIAVSIHPNCSTWTPSSKNTSPDKTHCSNFCVRSTKSHCRMFSVEQYPLFLSPPPPPLSPRHPTTPLPENQQVMKSYIFPGTCLIPCTHSHTSMQPNNIYLDLVSDHWTTFPNAVFFFLDQIQIIFTLT